MRKMTNKKWKSPKMGDATLLKIAMKQAERNFDDQKLNYFEQIKCKPKLHPQHKKMLLDYVEVEEV